MPSFIATIYIIVADMLTHAVDNGLMDDLSIASCDEPFIANMTASDQNHGPVEGHNCVPVQTEVDHHASSNSDAVAMVGRSILSTVHSDVYLDAVTAQLKTCKHGIIVPEHVGVVGGPSDKHGHFHRCG